MKITGGGYKELVLSVQAGCKTMFFGVWSVKQFYSSDE